MHLRKDEEGELVETGTFRVDMKRGTALLKRDQLMLAEPQLESWKQFYQEEFNLRIDTSKIVIPPYRIGINCLLVVAEGMTPLVIFTTLKQRFRCYASIDLGMVRSVRNATASYAVWARDVIESEENLKNISADQLQEKAINCITLEEHLLFHAFYYWKMKNNTSFVSRFMRSLPIHLDIKNWTLCAGSRFSDGGVPGVDWSVAGLGVFWYYASGADSGLRSRAVVSV